MPRLPLCSTGALAALALVAGCGQSASPPAAPAAAVTEDSPEVTSAMDTCSQFGSDDATRIAACNSIIAATTSATAVTRSHALNNRGVMVMQQGDPDRAIADFNAAIALNPTYGAGFFNRSKAYQQKGDAAHAQADDAEAVRLDPSLAGR